MIVSPRINLKKRKLERKHREQTDLARTLTLYDDATSAWIAKCVRLPVATLEQVGGGWI